MPKNPTYQINRRNLGHAEIHLTILHLLFLNGNVLQMLSVFLDISSCTLRAGGKRVL